MARFRLHFPLSPIASAARIAAACAALSAVLAPVMAQTAPPALAQQLEAVTVTGRAAPPLNVGGWGDIPLSKTPLQASLFGSELLKDSGAQRLSDLIGFDPAISDAYNAEGYYDFLTVRGFVIDNRFNYRRDGLPINAETAIALDNKSRVEILKGTSGMQAGTSAPGGLVNYVVKRPLEAPLRSASIEWRQAGSITAAVDLSQRFGVAEAFGVRLNAAAARLDPRVSSAEGKRHLFALAADWRLGPDSLLEAEFETSHRSQPSVPGFSLLGPAVPDPSGATRVNLNNQPWSLPVVFGANTASLRWQQRLTADWRFAAHAATQQLRTDDRIAFPFGCTDPNGPYYADRYCPDGTFDLYDFRSENERRRTDVIDLSLQGRIQTGSMNHTLGLSVQQSKVRNRFERQAFNYVGMGRVDASLVTAADPSLTDENTNRDERSTELSLRDAVAIDARLTAWLGVRHTRLTRTSVRTDGSRPTDYAQSFTTPWFALSHAFTPGQLVYASWGRGVESEVAPNRSRYINRGEALPTLKSRQVEVGVKGSTERFEWNAALFDIQRPLFVDAGACSGADSCMRIVDGVAHHRGVDASAAFHQGAWTWQAGAQWLHARVDGSATPANNGLEPTNVPPWALKVQAGYEVPALPGLGLQARLSREARRMVVPDNSVRIPAFTRTDVSARYETRLAGAQTIWRAGIDNVFDRHAWRESPYQFGHVYLFPLAPRTLRLSLQVDL